MNNTTSTKDKLKTVLLEWHRFNIPIVIERNFKSSIVDENRIVSIIGPRRAGKTWACYQLIRYLIDRKVPRENILLINFEDERLAPLDGSELTWLLEAHAELFNEQAGIKRYCFLDEIQNVPNWSKWVRRVSELHQDLTIILTGSSSKLLSTEIATELRGRTRSTTILPYSFGEFYSACDTHGFSIKTIGYGKERTKATRIFNDYLERGGFPAITGLTTYSIQLQEYYRTMFARDMIERFSIRHIKLFEDFLKLQLTRFASLSSISRLERELKTFGHSCNKNTLTHYFDHARDTFLLSDVPALHSKIKAQMVLPHKVYAVDHGLVRAIRFSMTEDRGRYLENIVFMELKRNYDTIFYHPGGPRAQECDFIIMEKTRVIAAIQTCWSMERIETRDREIKGLLMALESYKLKEGLILTADDSGETTVEGKRIIIKPVWLWALESFASKNGPVGGR